MQTFLQDMRYASRMLLKSPGFTGVALGLATIGTYAVISHSAAQPQLSFSLVSLHSLPVTRLLAPNTSNLGPLSKNRTSVPGGI
jgi:hypothetical protein